MSVDAIKSSLKTLFDAPFKDGEDRKIIYWQDRDNAFEDSFHSIEIEGVKKHILRENNYFKTKYLLEVEDTESNYLIYTKEPLSDDEENWLLDNILYSTIFYADETSLYCRELGIPQELRKVVADNRRFFRNEKRRIRFNSYNIDSFTEEAIELAIISVLTGQRVLGFEDSLRTIFMDGLDDNENRYLEEIERFFDIDKFWGYVYKHYGYRGENRSLKQLLIHLMITAVSAVIPDEKLDTFNNFIAKSGRGNCAIFIDRWMNHKTDYRVYDIYAEEIENEIMFSRILGPLDLGDIKTLDVFPCIDRAIITYMVDALERNLEDYEEYEKVIRIRRTKHFYNKYEELYEGLSNTIKMYEFRKLNPSIPIEQPRQMVEAYLNDYYLMDFYYRKFYIAFDRKSHSGVLQRLKDMVEGIYISWFMDDLSYNWSESIGGSMGDTWNIPGITGQGDFYNRFIEPKVSRGERVFVIISDALRYEAATELRERLEADTLGNAKLTPLLAGLPTNTKFGMARLLPQGDMELRDNGYVYIDNVNSGSMEGRTKILLSVSEDSTAIGYKDYMAMDKDDLREFYRGKKLNYIYHDTIDAIGDKASTEIKAFQSVETALEELVKLTNSLRGHLSATNIYITADHGFIYQRDELEEVDKMPRSDIGPIESKRRYTLSKDSRETEGLFRFSMKDTLGIESDLNVYIPKANIRFKTRGPGANFVHGGASLQEVVVPLIEYKNKTAGQAGAVRPKKTQIKLINTVRRITNSIFTLNFFQTERVGGKIIPCSVRVYMIDDNKEIISNEEILLGDKETENPKDRTISIRFILKPLDYDRNKEYYLIIRDEETGTLYDRIPFTISLGIGSDFDF